MTHPQPKYFIAIKDGERGRIFNEAALVISEIGSVFRKHGSGRLVFPAKGMWFTVTPAWLNLHLARNILFQKNSYAVDPPSWLIRALIDSAAELEIDSVDTSKLPSAQIAGRQ